MIDNRYIPLSIVVIGVLLGASVAYILRQHDLLRLLVVLGLASVVMFLMWQRE